MSNLYMHFHPNEHRFVDRAVEWVSSASEHHVTKRTDFLDPRQAHILTSVANRDGQVVMRMEGGYPEAERRRALIAPEYMWLDEEDMGIQVLSVTSDDSRISSLEHGDYMGALLGLGIKRDKTGDIHVHEQGCHYIVAEDIASFLLLHLQQVHRVKVMSELLPLAELKVTASTKQEISLSVASLRMDGIVSDVFRMSRAKVMAPIKAGRLRVNWKVEEDPSKLLREGDMVSLQGYGRFEVLLFEGISKSGRSRVRIAKYV